MTGRLYGADTELLSERPTGLVHVVLGSVSLSGSKETGLWCKIFLLSVDVGGGGGGGGGVGGCCNDFTASFS